MEGELKGDEQEREERFHIKDDDIKGFDLCFFGERGGILWRFANVLKVLGASLIMFRGSEVKKEDLRELNRVFPEHGFGVYRKYHNDETRRAFNFKRDWKDNAEFIAPCPHDIWVKGLMKKGDILTDGKDKTSQLQHNINKMRLMMHDIANSLLDVSNIRMVVQNERTFDHYRVKRGDNGRFLIQKFKTENSQPSMRRTYIR